MICHYPYHSFQFFTPTLTDVFSLEFEWQYVSSSHHVTFLYYGPYKKVVVWMVSIRPRLSKSFNPNTIPLVNVPRTLITNDVTVTFIIIIYSFTDSHICISWWLFTGIWVTANLLKSSGLFSVFWPFSIMLSFE